MSGAQSIYILTSRSIGQTKQLDAVANNVANTNTAGYKRQGVDFRELVGGTVSRPAGSFTKDLGFKTTFSQGALEQTGSPLDIALSGDGFLGVQAPGGGETYYTRAGQMTLDADGNLVTMNGDFVVDANEAPINIPLGSTEITISKDGSIANQDGLIGQIGLFGFGGDAGMVRMGDNKFSAVDAAPEINPEGLTVMQGFIETSNVNPVMETVKMTEVTRSYESIQSTIARLEELEQRAIRDLPSRQ